MSEDTVTMPRQVLADLVAVAAHVSVGASGAFSQDRPHPDARARRALGALAVAGLLDGVDEREPQ